MTAREPSQPKAATEIRCTCSAMPNQFEGRVNGKPFYFRARWGGWRLQINDDPTGEGIEGPVAADGLDEQAGWWDEATAEAFCREQLAKYAE